MRTETLFPPAGDRVPLEGAVAVLLTVRRQPVVYGLTDPTRGHAIAYVGQTIHLVNRYLQHVDLDQSMADAKRQWTRELRDVGLIPGLLVLEWVERSDDLLSREGWWIRHAREAGVGWLNEPSRQPPPRDAADGTARLVEAARQVAQAVARQRALAVAKQRTRARVATARRIYEGLMAVRTKTLEQAKAGRAAARQRTRESTAAFEARVAAEVAARTAALEARVQAVEAKVAVRARNTAHLGIRTFERPR